MVIKTRFFYMYHDKSGGWFRLFGYGLCWKPYNFEILFSERYGYRKYFRIGKWRFATLAPKQ